MHLSELPTVQLTRELFDKLGEYSCSLPTGVIIGKAWKRKVNYYDERDGWLLGEYESHPDPTKAIIRWSRIEIIERPMATWPPRKL